eukprot:gene12167-biopygen18459
MPFRLTGGRRHSSRRRGVTLRRHSSWARTNKCPRGRSGSARVGLGSHCSCHTAALHASDASAKPHSRRRRLPELIPSERWG